MSVRERLARWIVREANLSALIAANRGYGGGTGSVAVNQETALRMSAVWACLRLRANLVSSLPTNIYREVNGISVEVNKPPLFVKPWGSTRWDEHMYGTQYDLDRWGNTMGLIHSTDALGLPSSIEMFPMAEVSVRIQGRRIAQVTVNGEDIPLGFLWHEKQYAPAGYPVGMNPTQYAAWSIGGFLSAQERQLSWFDQDGASPRGVLRNEKKTLDPKEAEETKKRFKAATKDGDIFITGNDWTWTPGAVDAQSVAFLEGMQWGVQDVCRFYDVPGDLIDASSPSGSITYANISQRNAQLLITSLGPAIQRREAAYTSDALPRPRFMKINTDALLRMTPQERATVLTQRVAGRVLAPSEARALEDLEPFTESQLSEFDRLGFVSRAPAAAPPTTPPQQSNARWETPV